MAERIGYPVLVRPSYVLGGRAMAIVYDAGRLEGYVREAVKASPEHPILIDRFLEDAFEVDVDALGDGERIVIGGILQHIEEAGIHSGDSAMVLPTYKITPPHLATIREYTRQLGMALGVKGLMNIQYAIKDDVVYVLEVNPRASRTTPFVSKATGVPLAKVAAKIMAGRTLAELGLVEDLDVKRIFVKESVFPFLKFAGADILLGPEMKSTGEVMGISTDFGIAFAKSQQAAGYTIPTSGSVFISVNDNDKPGVLPHARALHEMGLARDRDARHGGVPERARRARRDRLQGERGAAERRGPDQERPDQDRLQHPARRRVLLRRRRHPQERHAAQRARRHDADRHRRDRAGDPGAARADDRHPEPAGDTRAPGARSEVAPSAERRP